MSSIDICLKRGHEYHQGIRSIVSNFGLTTRDEDILYCRRCGDIKTLSVSSGFYYGGSSYGGITWAGNNTQGSASIPLWTWSTTTGLKF